MAEDLLKGRILGSTEAALAVLSELKSASEVCGSKYIKYLKEAVPAFISARPTSLVMKNLLRKYLIKFVNVYKSKGPEEAIGITPAIIQEIVDEVDIIKDAVASLGSKRITDGDTILTHSYSSTIIRLFQKALNEGKKFKVIITESRPIGEGKEAASKISKLGIDTTLIVDSAVRFIMKKVNKVFVSADAVAANGAVVNKVGTSAIALAAKEARVRTYVTAGTYRLGLETVFGELIEGVLLSEAELIIPKERLPELTGKVLVRAPIFDVTPPEYIDAIITEMGLIAPQAIPLVIKEIYGWPPHIVDLETLLLEVNE